MRRWFVAQPTAAWYWISSAIAFVLYTVAAPVLGATYGIPVLAALFFPALQSAALIALIRVPWAATVTFAVAGFLSALWFAPAWLPWPWPVTTIIGFVVLVGGVWAIHGWRRGLGAFLIPGAAISLVAFNDPAPRALASWIVAVSLGIVAAGVGALLSDRIRIAGQLTRERAVSESETERRMVAEERQRIARELHDVVAHGLSLIQVQATSAPYRLPDLDESAAGEFGDIARAARESLQEMRRLLGALRGDNETAERAPQPTLGDIAGLVADAERAGATIRLEMPTTPPVTTAVEIAAFRIVQEAISNAVRHAPGAAIDVAVGASAEALLIEVQNDAAGMERVPPAVPSESGHGLVGMRERAALLEGSFVAGPTAAGGFRVSASLPMTDRPGAGEGEDPR